MKHILVVFVLLCTVHAFSQEKTFESEVKKISKNIELITKSQKDSLKTKVEAINKRLDKKEIDAKTATALKNEAASYHAKQIEILVGLEEKKLQQLVQDKTNGKIADLDEKEIKYKEYDDDGSFRIGSKTFNIRIKNTDDATDWDSDWNSSRTTRWERRGKRNRGTTTQFVFAMGVNNVLVDGQLSSLDNSVYKFWQSHFYELGWTWKTRMSREASKLYIKYGVSFLWNNLRALDNKMHVVNGDVTDLVVHPQELTESRLRHVQMTFPVHFEWDFSRNDEFSDGTFRDRTNNSVRFGIGAFFGFKLGTRQYLEYRDVTGTKVEEVQKDDFNTNVLNYGVSSYLAWKSFGLYAKYDLNPLFKDTETRNFSMGIRFDFN
ncbi:hypothetical protein GCM10011416_23690 [Polaribacter pacificus]|uniref:Outer membrane protein beta-barrel domain-containing protein n=1 Tax=Polaribacter pacificus TaxID=1775173 RepID=A0A917I1L2_9FLAO|nr:hypothetical protein [Polaribacter pacificus]GGH03884.1 hypothetical protein GCM10011416_23690 [Polaribacter pacificus]